MSATKAATLAVFELQIRRKESVLKFIQENAGVDQEAAQAAFDEAVTGYKS